MADELPKDQEPIFLPVESTIPAEQPKVRKALSQARRVLTEEEIAAPAARAMLLDELDRLEGEKAELAQYRSKFHETDKECAVLKVQEKMSLAADIISTSTMTLGGTLLGMLPSFWSVEGGYFSMVLIVSLLLIITGVAAKIIGRQ